MITEPKDNASIHSNGGHSPRKRVGMLGWRCETSNLQYSANLLKLRTYRAKLEKIVNL